MDDALAQVVMVTNTTPERASQYLTLADGDPDQAVTLFFESGGIDLVPLSQPSGPPALTGPGNSQNPIELDDDNNFSDDNDPQITGYRTAGSSQTARQSHAENRTYEDDAAMARRLQEEMYGAPTGFGAGGEDIVRAPIARQSETLLGPGTEAMEDAELPAAIQQRMQEMQRRRGLGARVGIFNQQPATSSIWTAEDHEGQRDTLARATGGASEASSKSSMLAKMFQPPWNLMYKGTWDHAREEGREEKKWLLVNIQEGSVFDCQVLNRDLWKNGGVVETVRENFLFLQYSKDDVRAEQYLQYYFTQSHDLDFYPHIAIIDPRTGEQVKVWSGEVPKPADFLMQVHEFLDRYSLSSNARNPVAKRKSDSKKDKDIHQMTEEEMLEKAMQESLATEAAASGLRPEDPDQLTRSIGELPRNGKTRAERATGGDADEMLLYENGESHSAPTTSLFSLVSSDRPHTEPTAGPNVTRIQFKHPGGRVIRRFELSDPVRRIYEWLKAEPFEGKEGAEFELVSMGKNLMESSSSTVEQAGLKNGTVMVEFLDD